MDASLVCRALQAASLALSASHNLTVTDRADLPRSQWPVYVLDHQAELALIEQAQRDIDEAVSTGNDRECDRCRTCPSRMSA